MYQSDTSQSGQILTLAIIVVSIVLLNTLFLLGGSLLYTQNSSHSLKTTQALNLAESGIDKAIVALNATGGSYAGEGETNLGVGDFSVIITTVGNNKIIESTGYVPSKLNPLAKKVVKVVASKGTGLSFKYGIQVGEGGLELGNNNLVTGSVYSNGNIKAGNNNEATGDIWIAGGTNPISDQSSDCDSINCQDFLFGKNVNGNNVLDIAQSFKGSTTAILNKVSIKIKKIGNPPDVTVRILAGSAGMPDKNTVLATGTLRANLVTTSYGWVDVTFNTSPNLEAETTYWFMIDTSADSNNYWSWQNDLGQTYARGTPSYSADWKDKSPGWTGFNGDLSFKTFVGGIIASIEAGGDFVVAGDVHANTIKNLTIQKGAYYQTIINSTAANYFPNSADPPPKAFPISEGNIAQWKQQAESFGIISNGVASCVATLGPGKIAGSILLGNGCNVTIKSPVWVTGGFNLNNDNIFTLASEYGDTSGVIIVDGLSDFGNGNKLRGTGVGSSILMLLSTYDSRTSGISAIKFNNNANSSFLYADSGIIEPGNNNDFKELTAWKIKLSNNSTINYETGLASAFFSSGPSGSYSLVKGTYQIK